MRDDYQLFLDTLTSMLSTLAIRCFDATGEALLFDAAAAAAAAQKIALGLQAMGSKTEWY